MQTHVHAGSEQSTKQHQMARQPTQLLTKPQATFKDNRLQATQLKNLQIVASNSPQQHKNLSLQAKMNGSMQARHPSITAGAVAQRLSEEESVQPKLIEETAQRETTTQIPKPNNTGLPDNLKSGIESISGMSMDHVKVNYNSEKPAQLNAHAYAQGNEIHLAPGQEQHLPHEAWHVVQQAQGRVKPTMQMKGDVNVNDDAGLETEADVMGRQSQLLGNSVAQLICNNCDEQLKESDNVTQRVVQRVTECQESDHYSDPIGLWIQEQYVADISGSAEKEYAVKAADNSWRYADIADQPHGEVYEIKSANIGAATAAQEAGYYRDRLNARCVSGRANGRWILGETFDTTWQGTFGNHEYEAWCPRKGAIIYQEVEDSDSSS